MLGYISGVILSFKKHDFRNVHHRDYNASQVDGFVETNFFGIPAWSIIVYFTNPCDLTESGRVYKDELAEVLLLQIGGKWVELERCQPNGPRMGDFYLQGCHPKMGTVYIYKFNPYSRCEKALLFYVSYDQNGSLVEFGVIFVGHGSPGPKTHWYAYPSGKPLEDLTPAAPPCFKNLKRYGFTSLQFYLIDNPDSIRCPRCHD
nr:uncharacterized protein LOC106684560 [Halyomorpha halys]